MVVNTHKHWCPWYRYWWVHEGQGLPTPEATKRGLLTMATKVTVPLWLLMLLVVALLVGGMWAYDTHIHRYICFTWGNPGETRTCHVYDERWP